LKVINVKPFLLLATRPEDVVADNEYESFLNCAGLAERHLWRHRLERKPLGNVELSDWSGILLGGSPFTTSDPEESKSPVQLRVESDLRRLLDQVVSLDFPFLGACYGIGTLGSHQGALVDKHYAEPIGPVQVTLTSEGRQDPLFLGLPDSFGAFVGHKDAVRSLPASAVLLAISPTCPVQGFRVGSNVYATQFHPELDAAGLCIRIDAYKNHGYFDPSDAEQLKEQAYRSDVRHAPGILRRFVERYSRPADSGPPG
jgi:GMP synthase (glutamine-hydrolysing)